MRKKLLFLITISFVLFSSCEEEGYDDNIVPEKPITETPISSTTISKLNDLGFNTTDFDVHKINGKIIVENDIILNEDQLNDDQLPNSEHYNTDVIVSGPRIIKVYVSTDFNYIQRRRAQWYNPTEIKREKYVEATQIAVDRYNAEDLTLTFELTANSSEADITIIPSPMTGYYAWYFAYYGILGSAGFPYTDGTPYDQIMMTRYYYDDVNNINGLATTIAHEMGHCIGFRHTDHRDRTVSCGSSDDPDEGADDANHIPGTTTDADGDVNSWMMACGSPEGDRPFTAQDKIALKALY